MQFLSDKTKRIRLIYVVYWILLFYIIAALIWWFIALSRQNNQMAAFEIARIKHDDPSYLAAVAEILDMQKRKMAQYIGEGSIFLLLILAGAFYIFRAVRKQFRSAQQQHNFMMAITHELKTPIAVTKLNLETLQRHKLDETKQQTLIANTIQEANRLNTLCNNMLLTSQMEAGANRLTKESINLAELTGNAVSEYATRFPQRSFVTQIDEGIFIEGDLLLLQIAVNNLLDNAIKYSPKDTAITVELMNSNSIIHLSVKDEGKGIEDSEKKKVFEKFYRIGNKATKEAKGTGLGLYLTKKIAQQHKATLTVTDNKPAGSNFTMSFPQ